MTGFRDRLYALYTYSDGGDDGVATSLYTYSGSFWGRLQDVAGVEITMGDGAKQRVDARLTLDLYTSVDENGIVSDGHGIYWRILGKTEHRENWEQVLTLVRAEEDEVANVAS